jgi:hypothetical protein
MPPPCAVSGRWSRAREFPQRAAHARGRNNVRCLATTPVIFQAELSGTNPVATCARTRALRDYHHFHPAPVSCPSS